jgi:CubicO group peptidase (beta-lactamase class C family)
MSHLTTPQVPVSATISYGLGWFVEDWKGQRLIHHGGNTFGFTSELAFLPEVGSGIVILTNAGRANDFVQRFVRGSWKCCSTCPRRIIPEP